MLFETVSLLLQTETAGAVVAVVIMLQLVLRCGRESGRCLWCW
jgi:hypothetical protein